MNKKTKYKVYHQENKLMDLFIKINIHKVNIKTWKAQFYNLNKQFIKNLIIKNQIKGIINRIFQVKIIYKFHHKNQLFIKIVLKLKVKKMSKIIIIKVKVLYKYKLQNNHIIEMQKYSNYQNNRMRLAKIVNLINKNWIKNFQNL